MNISPSKENILKKIRKALSESTPLPFSQSEGNSLLYPPPAADPETEFAEEFTRLQGRFVYCSDTTEMILRLSVLVKEFGWKNIYCNEPSLQDLLSSRGFPGITEEGKDQALPGATALAEDKVQPEGESRSANFTGDLPGCDVSITSCECLVARTGSIMLSAGGVYGRAASVYAPVHVCIAYTDQLVYDIKDGLQLVKEKYGSRLPSVISLATGPSRTADIEKTLVVGVHGPKEVYLFLIEREATLP